MTNKTAKQQPTITVRIVPGPVSPAARASWIKFWRKLASECKSGAGK